uniref:Uncharacterized protein n=1 Tax=Zooxanthella nutricula TaxID=1333877 RepID=A0A7S2LAD4_9DINO|mmetsp:Transcript_5831/g.17252  ORF Transcript_5831/g.17252 Transcript_5831/m.17252 type:complete len:432 (+) Transcript_5831:1-1296(+)
MKRLARSWSAVTRRKSAASRSSREEGGDLEDARLATLKLQGARDVAARALDVAAPGQQVPVDAASLRLLLEAAGGRRAVEAKVAEASPSKPGLRGKGAKGAGGGTSLRFEGCLFLVSPTGMVYVMTRVGDRVWDMCRKPAGSPHRILLFHGPALSKAEKVPNQYRLPSWFVYEVTNDRNPIIVVVDRTVPQDASSPPMGDVWVQRNLNGDPKAADLRGWKLLKEAPVCEPNREFVHEDKVFSMRIRSPSATATVAVAVRGLPQPESFEAMLTLFKDKLIEAARNVNTHVMLMLDLQDAAVTWAQTKRFLGWIDEVGQSLMLTVRGSAIRLHPQGIVGNMLLAMTNFVLKMKPPLWPNKICPTVDESFAFLQECEKKLEAELEKERMLKAQALRRGDRYSMLQDDDCDHRLVTTPEAENSRIFDPCGCVLCT